MPVEPDPLPKGSDDASSRIFAFVDDLFFMAKIQETARKLNVKVEFVKSESDLREKLKDNGDEKPSLIIFDLNNANAKPLTLIPKLKSKLKRGTSIIGFLSHVQGDLKQKAHEVGCDMVLPRSAFSQNLPNLLRRHGAPEELAN
jgi:DNA-binding NarL/FixJ family response regulator